MNWTPNPVVDRLIPPLSQAELKAWLGRANGFDSAMEYWRRHEAAIKNAEADPLRHGFELPFWRDFRAFLSRKTELYALGGNGPGKTEIGGKTAVEKLCGDKGMKVLCVATNENASKQLQQAAVYKYLPLGVKGMNERTGRRRRRDIISKFNYSQAGGFTEATFVLPNRSQCWFKTVEQYIRDSTSFEGPEYDLVWIDEPAPVALVDTLSYRVGKRRGKFLFTFTAVHGFDAVCARILDGAKVIKSYPINWQWRIESPADVMSDTSAPVGGPDPRVVIPELGLEEVHVKGCPPGHMPYMMQPINPGQGVIFMWTHWNLFLPRFREHPDDPKSENEHWPELFRTVRGKSKQTVRTRLFGWAEKISGCQFPQFNPNVHVVPAERVPVTGTDYMSGDPATARSYFMLWVRVDALGRKFIFDECPNLAEGEWVSSEGDRGDGTRVFAGRGSIFYKGLIRERERKHGREVLRRKGDPRAFATQAAAAEGGQSLFELYMNDDRGKDGRGERGEGREDSEDLAPMYWEPAKVRRTIDLDLEKVNDELDYDSHKAISIENEPRLYVAENCQNLIRAMLNWNPDQGMESPWKDPIDALRYLFDEPLFYVDPNVPEIVGGKGW